MNRICNFAVAMAAVFSCGTVVASANTGAEAPVMNVFGVKRVGREVNVKYFSRIEIKGSTDVVFRQTSGGRPQVKIVGNREDVERVKVSSDGKTLYVSEASSHGGWHFFSGGDEVKVYVSAPDLTAVSITGSADFDAEGKIDTDNLSVFVKGSGDVEMKNVICDNASVQVFGSGDVEIKNLVAQRKADINLKGSGDVKIGFTKSGHVSCAIYGSGDVELKGRVKSLKKLVRGSGDIDTEKLKRW